MTTYEWSRHAKEIEEARELGAEAMIDRALRWAEHSRAPELQEYRDALATIHESKGYCGGPAISRALEIILDGYLEEQSRREAA